MRSEGKFYDDKNFPRGFNRSGVFTISEASVLENYGRIMRALHEGTTQPIDESEAQFLAEVLGQQAAVSEFGKCWLKYLNHTTHKARSYTLCVSQRANNGVYGDDDDTDSGSDSDLDY
ncbi:DUF413 domain-containing protein [Photobacterium angustum]|uniref:Macrodomain Ori protein n=1 Tax=Photobacterium angustum TaxID=661 RepID=A0A855SFW6_PHOAN|nr:DUF413 domain-containing protein [Photobacterium angustum]KJF82233.1 hypothetical protein UB36_07755 [Photobacterium damselae subsp. damselae]KJG16902.1 hypothetical protein UA33_11405 [Photobacterium angustum]KJG24189.1 hypothetical protein UA39_08470 [Photobacterium angustum]KJG31792.1 hypothetical protein UA36_08605 [Photobacterium angustum]KJG32575.1 hypothetical protein UA69_06025 [Photobacterium angustum]